MWSWLKEYTEAFKLRNRKFNSIVGINPKGLDTMADNFDNLFSNLTSYKDEIASLTLYPFRIKPTDDTPIGESNNVMTRLTTTKGKQLDIAAINIDQKACLRNIGYVHIPHINSDFLDYNGYTKYSLFLPFFSTIELDASIFVDNYVVIRLAIDYYSGQGMYIISMSKDAPTYMDGNLYYNDNDEQNEVFVANYIFNLGIEIPIGSSNISEIKRNMFLGTIRTGVSILATAYGLALPPTTTISTLEESSVVSSRGDYKGARMIPRQSKTTKSTEVTTRNTPKNVAKPIAETVAAGVSILNNNYIQGHGDRSNNPMSMWSYGVNPYLIISTPKVDRVDDKYRHLKGLPLGLNLKLKQVSGFTKITDVHLEGIDTATTDELLSIEASLYEGVILPANEEITFYVNDDYYDTSKGFTWEQFVKTQPKKFRTTGLTNKQIEYLVGSKWFTLPVIYDDVIEDGAEISVG